MFRFHTGQRKSCTTKTPIMLEFQGYEMNGVVQDFLHPQWVGKSARKLETRMDKSEDETETGLAYNGLDASGLGRKKLNPKP